MQGWGDKRGACLQAVSSDREKVAVTVIISEGVEVWQRGHTARKGGDRSHQGRDVVVGVILGGKGG